MYSITVSLQLLARTWEANRIVEAGQEEEERGPLGGVGEGGGVAVHLRTV